jgi:hypothetical protein
MRRDSIGAVEIAMAANNTKTIRFRNKEKEERTVKSLVGNYVKPNLEY